MEPLYITQQPSIGLLPDHSWIPQRSFYSIYPELLFPAQYGVLELKGAPSGEILPAGPVCYLTTRLSIPYHEDILSSFGLWRGEGDQRRRVRHVIDEYGGAWTGLGCVRDRRDDLRRKDWGKRRPCTQRISETPRTKIKSTILYDHQKCYVTGAIAGKRQFFLLLQRMGYTSPDWELPLWVVGCRVVGPDSGRARPKNCSTTPTFSAETRL